MRRELSLPAFIAQLLFFAAFFAALGIVLESLLLVKFLLPAGKRKWSSAPRTGQRLAGKF
jgi:hypothetical protein